jgi:hypothetical protein
MVHRFGNRIRLVCFGLLIVVVWAIYAPASHADVSCFGPGLAPKSDVFFIQKKGSDYKKTPHKAISTGEISLRKTPEFDGISIGKVRAGRILRLIQPICANGLGAFVPWYKIEDLSSTKTGFAPASSVRKLVGKEWKDTKAWAKIKDNPTEQLIRKYLDRFTNGLHKEEAIRLRTKFSAKKNSDFAGKQAEAKAAADLARKQANAEASKKAKAAADLARKQAEAEAAKKAKAAEDLARKQANAEAAKKAKAAEDLAREQAEGEATRKAKAEATKKAKASDNSQEDLAKENKELKSQADSSRLISIIIISVLIITTLASGTAAIFFYIRSRDLMEQNADLESTLSRLQNRPTANESRSSTRVRSDLAAQHELEGQPVRDEFDFSPPDRIESRAQSGEGLDEANQDTAPPPPTLDQFLEEYRQAIFSVDESQKFANAWNAFGVKRAQAGSNGEAGTLVADTSAEIGRVEFWCFSMTSSGKYKYLILPGRNTYIRAPKLVADSGRPAERLFKGIFEIRGGGASNLEVLQAAMATGDGKTLQITKLGVVKLPI